MSIFNMSIAQFLWLLTSSVFLGTGIVGLVAYISFIRLKSVDIVVSQTTVEDNKQQGDKE